MKHIRIWSEARLGEGTVSHERSEATRAEAPVRRPEIRGRMRDRGAMGKSKGKGRGRGRARG